MNPTYEKMIQILSDEGFGTVDGWFSESEIDDLRKSLLKFYEEDEFRLAKIGKLYSETTEKSIRNDKIMWVDQENADEALANFFSKINDFIQYLNRTCYAGIRSSEFHYAFYKPGSFYKRHSDQFNIDDHRKYTFVFYLHSQWKKGDGGELVIYKDDKAHTIEPLPGKILLFNSYIEHEVLVSNFERLSLTGWLKTSEISLIV